MGFGQANFPGSVWDGFSRNRNTLEDDKSPSYNDWDEIVAEVIAIESSVIDANNLFKADVSGFSVGLCVSLNPLAAASSNAGEITGMVVSETEYARRGKIYSGDWTDSAGSVDLVVGATYFLRQFGQIRTDPPVTGYVISVGQAQTEKLFDFEIGTAIKL